MNAPPLDGPAAFRERWLFRWFAWYSRRYVAKQFDAVRLLGEFPKIPADEALVIYLNHASWWDPLAALVLLREGIPSRSFAAPIDAAALAKYGLFRRLGCFFGVEQGTARGARQFLRGAREILAGSRRGLCLTPQGRFADVRERPVRLASGLGHLLGTWEKPVTVLPLAVEYAFWDERTPNIFAHFGPPVTPPVSAEWQAALEIALATTQDVLAKAVIARDAGTFRTVISGRAGTGGVYGAWQRAWGYLRGQRSASRHSQHH
jgi:1-acyl-sn-glycerol-3-phosphate acyltransferase